MDHEIDVAISFMETSTKFLIQRDSIEMSTWDFVREELV